MTKDFFHSPNFGKFVLRLSLGFIVLLHGVHKLRFGIDFIVKWFTSLGLPTFLSYGVYVGEVIAPILIIIGLWVRPAAFILIVNMCVAMLFLMNKGYAPFSLNDVGGLQAELDFVILFGAVALFFLGGGKFSIDREN